MEGKPYNKIDHMHCWEDMNPACGLSAPIHRCCLCGEPVPEMEFNSDGSTVKESLDIIKNKGNLPE